MPRTTRRPTPRIERIVALSLGGNAGDPEEQLRDAVYRLRGVLGSSRVAPLYRTEPVAAIEQPDFFNTALVGRTDLLPEEVLALAKWLEWLAGRRPGVRFGPRPLDIDLLVHGDTVSRAPELVLPHPRLAERRFYLVPLARIAPDLAVPPHGTTVAELLAAGSATGEVREVGWSHRDDPRGPGC